MFRYSSMPFSGNRQPSRFLVVSKELKRVFFIPPFLNFSLRVFHRREPSENGAKLPVSRWLGSHGWSRTWCKGLMSRTCLGQRLGGGRFGYSTEGNMGSKPGGWWGWLGWWIFFFFFTLSVFEVVGTKWFVSMLKPFGYFDFLVIKWDAWPLGLLPVWKAG